MKSLTLPQVRLYAFIGCSSIGNLAESCIRFGVAWHVLQVTGSVTLFATLVSLSLLVEAFAQSLLSPLSDYFNRLGVYKTSTAIALVVSLGLWLATLVLPFSAALLGGVMVALALIAGLRDPNATALVAQLAEPAELTRAQSVQMSAGAVTGIAGPAVAGLLVALAGPAAAMFTGAAFELIGLLGAYAVGQVPDSGDSSQPRSWAAYARTWHRRTADGLLCLWKTKAERDVVISAVLARTGTVAFLMVVLPVWAARELGGAQMVALLEGSFSAGILLGSSVAVIMLNRRLGRARTMVLGPALGAFAFGAAAFTTSPFLLVILVGLIGTGVCMAAINTGTVRALATPDDYRARMAGAGGFAAGLALPLGAAGFGWLLEVYPTNVSIGLCAALFAGGAYLLARNKVTRSLLGQPDEHIVGRYRELYPHAFPESGR